MPKAVRPPGLRAGIHLEVDDRHSGLSHAGEQWAPARFEIADHAHPVWEFYLQAHGVTRWTAGAESATLGPGQLLGVPPGVRHQLARTGGNHHFYFAAIDLETVLERAPALATLWRTAPAVIHRRDAHELVHAFEQLVREASAQRDYAALGLALVVDRLVLEISRLLLPNTPRPHLAGHPAVAQVRQLIDRDSSRAWTLAGLAEHAGLNPTYLAALFGVEQGCSPHRYLVRRRIEHAKHLLSATTLSVSAIALDVGFGSGQHLARAFRREAGLSPREFRDRARD